MRMQVEGTYRRLQNYIIIEKSVQEDEVCRCVNVFTCEKKKFLLRRTSGKN